MAMGRAVTKEAVSSVCPSESLSHDHGFPSTRSAVAACRVTPATIAEDSAAVPVDDDSGSEVTLVGRNTDTDPSDVATMGYSGSNSDDPGRVRIHADAHDPSTKNECFGDY